MSSVTETATMEVTSEGDFDVGSLQLSSEFSLPNDPHLKFSTSSWILFWVLGDEI